MGGGFKFGVIYKSRTAVCDVLHVNADGLLVQVLCQRVRH